VKKQARSFEMRLVVPIGRQAPGRIAAVRPLYLDDIGAVVGE
jgi:hypothetical protein